MNKAEYSELILSDNIPWSCVFDGAEKIAVEPLMQISEQSRRNGEIKVIIKTFSTNNSLVKVKRIEVLAGDRTAFVVDKVLSQIPVDVKTNFRIKCGRDLRCNVAEKNKLVIRSNGIGAKFFRLMYQADGEDILKSAGLVLPDGFSENGDMGLTYYSGLHKFAKEHIVLYGICTDRENRIAGWHFFDENGFVARPPSQLGGYRIILSKENLYVENSDASHNNIEVDV